MPKRVAKRRPVRRKVGTVRTDSAVAEFLRELDHPLKKEIEAIRKTILGASPAIREGIKWNSLSFLTTEWFATVNWRCRDRVQLVFHRGAKVKDNSTKVTPIADPAGLIKWLAKDRCLVTLDVGREFKAHQSALRPIVRAWIEQM